MPARFRVDVAATGFASLRRVRDRKTLRELDRDIQALAVRPEEQGKPLNPPFEGVRSLWAVRDRYRILYKIINRDRSVAVLPVAERQPGREEDVYVLARKLLKGLLRGTRA